ncbi:hypothetical protein [Pseudomonas syringae]|uniref:hypothetical protein n=1 Tax=Pseudomonas syringae TaxID=317 RepID=UPI000352111E|nr:hypothetical protein [Pseudomonas syringae]EPF65944.1 Hypothetical protein PssSM_1864 [Pseudomonas syringae pv. syringae SM]
MQQHSINDVTRTIYVLPSVAGIYLDYSLGEEIPLFAPLPTDALVCGVGYNSISRRKAMGLPYHATTCRAYRRWIDMLRRCYESYDPAYSGCTVCKKWHDFQEFADWFTAQPYANEPDAELDKDILDRLNRIYSPELCSLVPTLINQMFRDTRSQRGNLPIGVKEGPRRKGFTARISKYGKQVHLGTFKDIFSAFEAYKEAFSAYYSEIADEYEGMIDSRVIKRLRTCSRHIHD